MTFTKDNCKDMNSKCTCSILLY